MHTFTNTGGEHPWLNGSKVLASMYVSSNFTFGLIPLGNLSTPYPPTID